MTRIVENNEIAFLQPVNIRIVMSVSNNNLICKIFIQWVRILPEMQKLKGRGF